MVANNGKSDPGPPYLVVGGQAALLPYQAVVEMMEKNATEQAKINLPAGPLFREIADAFREFHKIAEPGMSFRSPETSLFIVRLSANIAPTIFVSRSAQDQSVPAEEPPNDRGLILHP